MIGSMVYYKSECTYLLLQLVYLQLHIIVDFGFVSFVCH